MSKGGSEGPLAGVPLHPEEPLQEDGQEGRPQVGARPGLVDHTYHSIPLG